MTRFLPLFLLAGCMTADGAQERWDSWVQEHNQCDVPEDCTLVYPSCPLGCFEAVSTEFADEARDTADRLIARYERGGVTCDYDCIEAGPLGCEANTCVVLDALE